MSGEPEPRRSVRATKGQHKALEQLDKALDAPKRRGKKGKKAARETEEPEEEIIRCVCGATEQHEDSGEPWIACDTCGAWQHNICMGMSQYSEDLPSEYFCERCRPENHKELVDGIARGEQPWGARRKAYEEEEAEGSGKRKKRGPKKGKGKRLSDTKDEPKQSPAPEPKKETKVAAVKRKTRDESQDKDTMPPQKQRRVSEAQSVATPVYDAPDDIPAKIAELPDTRQNPAKALLKSLTHSIGLAEKKGTFVPTDGISVAARAERFALQIERAVQDTHPTGGAYGSQVRTLTFNLKSNPELASRLLSGTLTPPMLAAMTTEELASKEQQRENAEMKARAEKQSILITEEGPRVRRTHKGEEMVGDDNFAIPSDETPGPSVGRRQSSRRESQSEAAAPPPQPEEDDRDQVELPAHFDHPEQDPQSMPQAQPQTQSQPPARGNLHIETRHSPKTSDFDIKKVFSSVRSPTGNLNRRPSNVSGPAGGPGVDPEVDRMLQDDGNESPPYSPSEESDPTIVWRGDLVMNTISSFQATARHVGGAPLPDTVGVPWSSLVPRRLTVAGRIDQQKAIEYLCSLRYSIPTDVVVLSLEPALEASKPDFQRLIDYFVTKKRYGVIGDKGVANVRDTYLVPVLPGSSEHQPEFMLNLGDNLIPETRTEPMLLAVFVYRNDPSAVQRFPGTNSSGQTMPQSPAGNTPTPAQGAPAHRSLSIPAPAFSPTSPQGTFPNSSHQPPRQSQTPIQPPPVPHNAQHVPQQHNPAAGRAANQEAAQRQGEKLAREVLGPFISSPTVTFLLPQAHHMSRKEWEVVRKIYERDTRTREDLNYLSVVLEKENSNRAAAASPPPNTAPAPAPAQPPAQAQGQAPTLAAAPAPAPPHVPVQTPIHPPVRPQRNTPIPPPPIPAGAAPAGPPRQTPIPPPPIPPHATTTATAPPA